MWKKLSKQINYKLKINFNIKIKILLNPTLQNQHLFIHKTLIKI